MLSESMEDYLEAIFEIGKTKQAVRVKDVASRLGVSMPSVNNALKNLEDKALIQHEKYQYIELTAAGTRCASQLASRHNVIRSFFHDILGVSSNTAEEDACRAEHVLSNETMDKLVQYVSEKTRTA
jgi:DtxR family Mn-dependent transcriptional regulator